MKLMYKLSCLFIVMLLSMSAICQDINFSQFYELPLLRNPALAGIIDGNNDIRVTAAYRNQWQSVTVPFQTMALNVELRNPLGQYDDPLITTGLIVTTDQAGDSKFKKTQLLPVVNLLKNIDQERSTYIGAGIMGGPVQQHFDPSKLYFDDQFVNGSYSSTNPTRQTFSNTNFTYWDFNAGISYSSEFGEQSNFYVGVGAFHILQPKVAFLRQNDIKLNRKYVVNFGLFTRTGDFDGFTIYGDYFNQGGNNLFQGGFLFSHDLSPDEDPDDNQRKMITGGVFYRWHDAVVPVVKLNINQLAIGVSYDINISKLSVASKLMGGLEVTLSYKNFLNIRNSDLQSTKCPKFGFMPKVY